MGLMSPPLSSIVESNNCFACFFSLLREKFRSSLDYKMTVEELEEAVADWESQVVVKMAKLLQCVGQFANTYKGRLLTSKTRKGVRVFRKNNNSKNVILILRKLLEHPFLPVQFQS